MHPSNYLDKYPIIKLMLNLFYSRNMNDCANLHLPCFLKGYSGSSQAYMMKAFGKISKQLLAVDYDSQSVSYFLSQHYFSACMFFFLFFIYFIVYF